MRSSSHVLRVKTQEKPGDSASNLTSSFRDPSGHVFSYKGVIYRQINEIYKKDYELLLESGLYTELTKFRYLVEHAEIKDPRREAFGWKIIQPEQISFISYPYEWSFSMLKDAALLTLNIQKIALRHNMSLKDASAFNIQFVKGKPILLDTLSFEVYEEGKPWVAYKQFVEHFLVPLALMSYVDVRLNRLSSLYLDGIPVDLGADILPFKARFKPSLLFHIFAHAASSKKYEAKKLEKKHRGRKFSKNALLGMIDNLEGAVKGLKWNPHGTQWEDYYEEDKNNYKTESMRHKGELVFKFIKEINSKTVWDMGANTGHFSRIAGKQGAQVVAFDVDFGAIEKAYRDVKKRGEENILPLFSDFTNPTPGLGWMNQERMSLVERGPADTVLALALIHHLAISHNLPFSYLAQGFAKIGKYLIIEFVDKKDSQVQILLSTREDIFPHYTKEDFEREFEKLFTIQEKVSIKGSLRTLYLMEKR